jgi:hypothetical protein
MKVTITIDKTHIVGFCSNATLYHSRFILEGVAEASPTFLRDAQVLPKLLNYEEYCRRNSATEELDSPTVSALWRAIAEVKQR